MREQQLNLAYLLWSQGKTEQAKIILQHLLQHNSQDADVLHFMGVLIYQEGEGERALQLVRQAIDLKPTAPQFWNSLGNLLRDGKQWPEAANAYQQAIHYQPHYSNAHYNLGVIEHLQGDKIGAEANFRQSLALTPQMPEAHYNLANLLKENGNWAEAKRHYQEAVHYRPSFAEAWNNLGMLYQQEGECEKARHCYQQSLVHNPQQWETYYNLGQLCEDLADWEGANQAYQTLMRQYPTSGRLWNQLGNLYYRQGQTAMARMYYEQAVQLAPHLPEIHHNLASLLTNLGEFTKALHHYQEALKHNPTSIETWNNLGNLYHRLSQPVEAIRAYEKAIQLNPHDATMFNNLGTLLEEMGRLDEALGCYRKGLELQPNIAELHNNLANLLVKTGFGEKALSHYHHATQIKPELTTAWFSLATTYMEDGWVQEAAAIFQDMATRHPQHPLLQRRASTHLLCSPFMADETAIDGWYQSVLATIEHNSPLDLDPFASELISSGLPPCGFAFYHGNPQRLRRYRETYARQFYSASAAERNFPRNAKPRVGLVVTPRHESSFISVMKYYINRFAASDLELWLVCPPECHYRLAPHLQQPELRWLSIPTHIDQALDALRQANLDLLHYWEIGSDALNYFLPFFRPAPIQTTSLGLPATSGISTVTAFLSCQMAESDAADSYYTEQLMRMNHLPLYVADPPPLPPLTRSDFGWAESDHLYLCTQHLLKIQPIFDDMIQQVLEQDPTGKVVLFKRSPNQTALLQARLEKRLGAMAKRVVFLPYLPYEQYLSLLQLADVVLDTTPVGGGLTTVNTLAAGVPLLTLTGDWLWGRMGTACYQWMGIDDNIAPTPEVYVSQALRLASDRDYQQHIRQKIRDALPALQTHLRDTEELTNIWRQLLVQHGRA